MKNRILYVAMNNIKSIENGTVSFLANDIVERGDFFNDSSCDILGIYGQNGSGKTSVFACFEFLKALSLKHKINDTTSSGERKSTIFDYLVRLGKESGSIEYGFLIFVGDKPYKLSYKVELKKENSFLKIKKESLTAFNYFEKGERWKYPFAPQIVDFEVDGFDYLYDGQRHEEGYKNNLSNNETVLNLLSKKKDCYRDCNSFIFSDENIEYLKNGDDKMKRFGEIVEALVKQIVINLFIYGTKDDGLSQVGLINLLGIYKNKDIKREIHGHYPLQIAPFFIRKEDLDAYRDVVKSINLLMSSFIANFKLIVLNTGVLHTNNGVEYVQIAINRQLDPNNNLPLSEESSGIRKLYSIACALIYIYGQENGWLVVDELDSGVFEDLLGQLLRILEENGKGQLLFTAHNLCPLERISKKSIVFTTFNPNNRFISFKGLSKTSNLRDLYLRALKLGGQDELLSSSVNDYEIDDAFYTAFSLFNE